MQWEASIWRIPLKPIFCSKLFGYITVVKYGAKLLNCALRVQNGQNVCLMLNNLFLKLPQNLQFGVFGIAAVGMFAQRQIKMRFACQDSLRVRELAEAPFAVVGTHA